MVIGIDPGKNTGIAIIIQPNKIITEVVKYSGSMDLFVDTVISTCSKIADLKKSIVFIEGYRIYNSPISIMTATTHKLDIIITESILINERIKKFVRHSFLVNPIWKGTMDDSLVKARVDSIVKNKKFYLPGKNLTSHEYDAIGIALNGVNLFNTTSGKK